MARAHGLGRLTSCKARGGEVLDHEVLATMSSLSISNRYLEFPQACYFNVAYKLPGES
jgi:hypothetical protein